MIKLRKLTPVLLLFVIATFNACLLDDTTPAPDVELEYLTLEDFYKKNMEAETVFEISGNEAHTVTTPAGAVLNIPPDAFKDAAGDVVSTSVSLHIIELYSKSDMILANKPTLSGNKLLESAGAFRFSAFSGEEMLELNEPIGLAVPVLPGSNTSDMGLFTANSNPELPGNPVDWELEAETSVSVVENFYECFVDELKWINLDHFYNPSVETTTVNIKSDNLANGLLDQHCFIVFKNINAVAGHAAPLGESFEIPGIPVGEEVVILLIALGDFDFYLGQSSGTIAPDDSFNINVEALTEEDLRNTIDGLN